jgi:Glycosyl transferase family 1
LTSILYYITDHGFGHTVRSVQVIRAVKRARPELSVHVRTTAPEWLIQHPQYPIYYSRQALDIGVIQRDTLQMELGETLSAWQALRSRAPKLIRQEVDFVRRHRIQLIVADIPALCFAVAEAASIPSVAVANFVWSWVYRAYLKSYPDFLPLIEELDGFYRKATLALTLPYACDMEIFLRRETIPWIARTSDLSKEKARDRFGLPRFATIVLLSFGGFGMSRLPWNRFRELKDFIFITTGRIKSSDGNVFVLPDTQPQYEDLVRAADVIVTKPGYGIVADIIAHRVPALYTDRGEFPEYPRLVQALSECATAHFISQRDLFSGAFCSEVPRLLERRPNWPDVPLDGATVAAEKILATLDRCV